MNKINTLKGMVIALLLLNSVILNISCQVKPEKMHPTAMSDMIEKDSSCCCSSLSDTTLEMKADCWCDDNASCKSVDHIIDHNVLMSSKVKLNLSESPFDLIKYNSIVFLLDVPAHHSRSNDSFKNKHHIIVISSLSLFKKYGILQI